MEMFESGRPVTEQCPSCGRPMDQQVRPFRRIRPFFRFVLSVAPGVGHMYMGFMQRGMQLLVGTLLLTAFLALLVGPFALLAFWILVAFSVFDAREAHLRLEQGLEVDDEPLLRMKNLELTYSHKYVAYGLIGLGSLIFYAQFVRPIMQRLTWHYKNMVFMSQVDGALFGLAVLAAGIYLLRRQVAK